MDSGKAAVGCICKQSILAETVRRLYAARQIANQLWLGWLVSYRPLAVTRHTASWLSNV